MTPSPTAILDGEAPALAAGSTRAPVVIIPTPGQRAGRWVADKVAPAVLGFAAFFVLWYALSLISKELPNPWETGRRIWEFLRTNMWGDFSSVEIFRIFVPT